VSSRPQPSKISDKNNKCSVGSAVPILIDEDDAGKMKTLFSWRVVVTTMARYADSPKEE
jgi:hypothetical protein